MKIIAGTCAVLLAIVCTYAIGADGMIAVKTSHAPKDAMDRLEALLRQKGLTIFAPLAPVTS